MKIHVKRTILAVSASKYYSSRVEQPFQISLERSVGAKLGRDLKLWNTGKFCCSIFPDFATVHRIHSFKDVISVLKVRFPEIPQHWFVSSDRLNIRTVAVQVNGRKRMRSKIANACGVSLNEKISEIISEPDGLLIVSGSHPLRRFSFFRRFDSIETIRMAREMQKEGIIPTNIKLWAVANTNAKNIDEEIERTKKKIDAGATTIVTQPPLLWSQFVGYMDKISQSNIFGHAQFIIGIPVISVEEEETLWKSLCDMNQYQHVELPPNITSLSQTDLYIHAVTNIANVGGIHIMALKEISRQKTFQLAESGVLDINIGQ